VIIPGLDEFSNSELAEKDDHLKFVQMSDEESGEIEVTKNTISKTKKVKNMKANNPVNPGMLQF
jgi:hypothetical protein